MKIKITMKNPDSVYDAIEEGVRDSLPDDLDEEETEALFDCRKDAVSRLLGRWIEYGEYIRVEFDTKEETAKVLEVK